jgi:transcriptional regulator with XRE-family HTH domain
MLSVVKTKERLLARELRARDGLSIKAIAGRLGVAQATVSLWVRDIKLTPEQEAAMMAVAYRHQSAARERIVANRRRERLAYQEHGRDLARKGDVVHAAGCMLYWAEGDKARNQARMSNSDPHLLRFFVDFLRRYFDISSDDIRVNCHLFADHVEHQRDIEQFWLDQLGLTPRSLRKSFVNVYSLSSKRKRVNMLPYGTFRVGVSRTSVVQSIYGSIQEYAGFERPEWLD